MTLVAGSYRANAASAPRDTSSRPSQGDAAMRPIVAPNAGCLSRQAQREGRNYVPVPAFGIEMSASIVPARCSRSSGRRQSPSVKRRYRRGTAERPVATCRAGAESAVVP